MPWVFYCHLRHWFDRARRPKYRWKQALLARKTALRCGLCAWLYCKEPILCLGWGVATAPFFLCHSSYAAKKVLSAGLAVGQQAAGQAFDIAGFGDGRVYWMIRALTAAFEQLDISVQMAGTA